MIDQRLTLSACLLTLALAAPTQASTPRSVVQVDLIDGAVQVAPASLALYLDRPEFVEWTLTGAAAEQATDLRVSFERSPFARPAFTGAGSCETGPAPVDVETGTYPYSVTVMNGGNTIASTEATIVMHEFSGLPAWIIPAVIITLLLFLLFNYIEAPLTRSYETSTH